ncbi:hypothetical protein [Solirhodobacter olei]|uniref:hypothetical protein n=1 Tax=Solirhodobacter olei TaxID=2493082 RepID=UPI0013E40C4D|nr:hypothetical protein [Solirhodobacter olei]
METHLKGFGGAEPLFVGGRWVWMSGSSGSSKYWRHKVFSVRGCTLTDITANAAMRPTA